MVHFISKKSIGMSTLSWTYYNRNNFEFLIAEEGDIKYGKLLVSEHTHTDTHAYMYVLMFYQTIINYSL